LGHWGRSCKRDMRASSAAFHRSWWRRRTGFIADMYGCWLRGRRSVLRGNSCVDGRWRRVARRKGVNGNECGVARVVRGLGEAATVPTGQGQLSSIEFVAVFVQSRLSRLEVATIAVRPLSPINSKLTRFKLEPRRYDFFSWPVSTTPSTHPARHLTINCESICLSSRYTGDSPLF